MSNATTVKAYAYSADIHCIDCTKAAYAANTLTLTGRPIMDWNGLPTYMDDREGNPVGAVFYLDFNLPQCCGTCGKELA